MLYMSKTAPDITAECKEMLEAKSFSKVEQIIDHHEVIVIEWNSPPTQSDRERVESVFQSVSNRISEEPVGGVEDVIDTYSFDGEYGEAYTTYYLAPTTDF